MGGEIDDLIIPVRLETGGAAKNLGQLEQAGRSAAGGVEQGFHRAGAAAKDLGGEVGALLKAQMGFSALTGAANTFGASLRESAEYIARMSKEFQAFRASLQGVAALSGQENTNKFAASEIDRAERAHVTPGEMKDFRDAFLSRASLYVGEGPQAKLHTEDADKFQEYLAEYAKLKGVGQSEMASFAGGLLAQQKGPTTLAEMKGRVGRVFGTLEASSAPVAHLLPAMTRTMAQGFSAEEASRTLAAMPEIAPEEESTHLLRVMADVRKLEGEGKSGEYGITEGMSPQQQLEQLVTSLRQRSGGDAKKLNAEIARVASESISSDTLRGMVNQVDFGQWRQVQEGIGPDELESRIRSGRESDAGKQYALDSALAVEQARMGMRGDPIERLRQKAETHLIKTGQFERTDLSQMALSPLELVGADDRKDRMINLTMLRHLRRDLGEGSGIQDEVAALNKRAANNLARDLMERLPPDQRSGILAAPEGRMPAVEPQRAEAPDGRAAERNAGDPAAHDLLKQQTDVLRAIHTELRRPPESRPLAPVQAPMSGGGVRQ